MARDVCLWIQRCPSATTASSCREASPPSIYRTPSESCLFLWLSCQLNHSLCKVVSLFVRPEGRPLEDGLPAGGKGSWPYLCPQRPRSTGGGGEADVQLALQNSRCQLQVGKELGIWGGGGEEGLAHNSIESRGSPWSQVCPTGQGPAAAPSWSR